ncbi:hypothetical protein A3860_11965 [Niastella vici]|uniref:Uncharacterized protein n=1 Tax=Niastella vici TaxID=1703345 RepID=A0A1V9FFY3_9BACT|nr:hypothetical protein [Niastella vici]OQP57264.1 hypothetical protein A3860_11965 [Niastella vici]
MRKKILLIISVLTIVLFSYLTISTAEIRSGSDGEDTYGYPLTFFIRFSGECDPCLPDAPETEINFLKLLLDLLFAAIFPILGWAFIIKVKKDIKKDLNK